MRKTQICNFIALKETKHLVIQKIREGSEAVMRSHRGCSEITAMQRELQHTHTLGVWKCVKWFPLLHQVPCDVPVHSLIVLRLQSPNRDTSSVSPKRASPPPSNAVGRGSTPRQIALIYTHTHTHRSSIQHLVFECDVESFMFL